MRRIVSPAWARVNGSKQSLLPHRSCVTRVARVNEPPMLTVPFDYSVTRVGAGKRAVSCGH